MKFLSFVFAAIAAVSAVEASTLRASSAEDVTGTVVNQNGPALDEKRGDRELADFHDDYDYKKIYTTWTSVGKKCWDVYKDDDGTLYLYAKVCKFKDSQYWTYTTDGQIYNKEYEQCVFYDTNHDYLYLADCDDHSSFQRFLYVDKHWVSAYDGTCIDLDREHGGYYTTEKCKKCWKDHLHTIEESWFYDWDDSYCD